MEDVLAVYARPYDPKRPVICLDEASKELHGTPRGQLPLRPGQPVRQDYEYERHGVANLFLWLEPLTGRRKVRVTDILIVDGASICKSKSTLAWLKERPQIVLVPLPSYAPKLNLQEQIWRWLRADVTHDHFFGSLDAVVAAAKRFFAKVAEQPAAVLSRIGRSVAPLERNLALIT